MYNEITNWFKSDNKNNVPCMMTLALENGDEPYGEIVNYDNDYVVMRFDNNNESSYLWRDIVNYQYHQR